MKGRKNDRGKDRWDLLPWDEVRCVVQVLTLGAEKYEDDNWKRVPNSRERYFAAAQRHITAWWSGERWDEESGMHHLAHAICCLLFAMWHDCQDARQLTAEYEAAAGTSASPTPNLPVTLAEVYPYDQQERWRRQGLR